MTLHLGRFGVWLGPAFDDGTRRELVVEAEALDYGTAWLGMGKSSVADLESVSRILDATSTITVATGIVNMWTNDATTLARSYRRIADRHADRFLLGVGVGHREAVDVYRRPYEKMVEYLDQLDSGGVPEDRRVLAALGPRALKLAADRTAGAHPYLVVPDHTRQAREIMGPGPLLAPEHKAVVDTDDTVARALGREVVANPYLQLRNYVNNLLRLGYTEDDVADGGSDRLIDALALHGTPATVAAGLTAHLDAGADHVAVQVLAPPGEDPMPGYRALAAVLN
ncbi:LLM class F420-dependent oxidoreductase [Streptosporangium sp. KLBMP 9127]|nr:LLM class F420-dependent oxidoreductase [Streptosporangium sp. KLBMP 9127]